MRRWVLAIAILAAASAAALFFGAEAQAVQQGHQAERISGERRWTWTSLSLAFVSILISDFDRHILVSL